MDYQAEEIVYDKDVVEFITVANQFCSFIEDITDVTKGQFIDQSLKIGALLYLKASTLPDFEKIFENLTEKFVSEYEWQMIASQISLKLGEDDKYIAIYVPSNVVNDEKEELNFSEAFSDIYQDLKNITTNYKIASHEIMNDALWECKENFTEYWGPRILAILSGFHALKYNQTSFDEEGNNNLDTSRSDKTNRQQFLDFQQNQDDE